MGKVSIFANGFGYLAAILLTGLITFFLFCRVTCTEDQGELKAVADLIYDRDSTKERIKNSTFIEVLERSDLKCYQHALAHRFVESESVIPNNLKDNKLMLEELQHVYDELKKKDSKVADKKLDNWSKCGPESDPGYAKCCEEFRKHFSKPVSTPVTPSEGGVAAPDNSKSGPNNLPTGGPNNGPTGSSGNKEGP